MYHKANIYPELKATRDRTRGRVDYAVDRLSGDPGQFCFFCEPSINDLRKGRFKEVETCHCVLLRVESVGREKATRGLGSERSEFEGKSVCRIVAKETEAEMKSS